MVCQQGYQLLPWCLFIRSSCCPMNQDHPLSLHHFIRVWWSPPPGYLLCCCFSPPSFGHPSHVFVDPSCTYEPFPSSSSSFLHLRETVIGIAGFTHPWIWSTCTTEGTTPPHWSISFSSWRGEGQTEYLNSTFIAGGGGEPPAHPHKTLAVSGALTLTATTPTLQCSTMWNTGQLPIHSTDIGLNA